MLNNPKKLYIKRTTFSSAPLWAKINLASASIAGITALSLIYKLLTEPYGKLESLLKKETFHTEITIDPGQTVEKIFWLKDPTDHITINFDEIQTEH